ncbi:hypothetical protein C8R46DRAFT_288122 [Mycena filopes]|nr:hypothetical protein C8R46DRAFT_288122 [Mycena filopes]
MHSSLESDPDDVHVGKPQQDDSEQDPIPYPVLTLPNEIVSEIFISFLPPYPECPPWTKSLSPSLLTQICGKWREIALSTPELWRASAFHLDIPPDPRLRAARRAQLEPSRCQAWLERSRACPLSLQLVSHWYQDHERVSQFLDAVIIPHRARWEHLKLDFGDAGPLLRLGGSPMPLLLHLEVNLAYGKPFPVSVFHDAPLLRTVVLNFHAIAALVLPWAQLTKVVLHHVYPSDCSTVLQQTTNLVHCEIPFLCFDVHGHSVEPDVNLPHLGSLVFGDESDTITTYHGTFIVPALRRLHIPERFLGSDCIDSLRGFIAKSGCHLREVLITGPLKVDRHEYHAAFPSIPSLCFDQVETST